METYTYGFENLVVWQKAKELVKAIYQVTKKFPREEKFGMIDQLRRAAVSMTSNLAEGSARKSLKEQARFTEISYSSLMEVLSEIIISYELKYLPEKEYFSFRKQIQEISRMLNGLRNSQLGRKKS